MSLSVDIEKTYGEFTLHVAFETENEVFAILGASGCGKSLTLKCIAGIERPDRGVIRLDGDVLFDSERRINVPARKRNIGYLFQDYALFPNMTVLENIMCGAKDRALAQEFVERFYLEGKERLYPRQLSGGQKQRVALARMLAARPKYLLLDEPFSALDNHLKSRLERELMDVMDRYGRHAIFVSHDRNEVYRMTDRIAVMDNGDLVDIRPKAELFKAPRTLAATLLTGCKNVTGLERREGRLYAVDWGIYLHPAGEDAGQYRYAAVRAHYFEPMDTPEAEQAAYEQAGSERMELRRNELEQTVSEQTGSGQNELEQVGAERIGLGQDGTGLAGLEGGMDTVNCIECEIIREIEDTFSMVVLFRNKNSEQTGEEAVLTAEFSKEEWEVVRSQSILQGRALWLRIPEERIILLER